MSLQFFEYDSEGIQYGYDITEILMQETTKFQNIKVVDTKAYGRMMIIDDFVMLTESDEFVYHEMISHVPVSLHQNPRNIVVIGGGDGGTVRELLKHSFVERVTLCEIDGAVIEASKKYFPEVASGFDDPRVEVMVGDGVAYMARHTNEFDLVVIDSTDPVGPGEGLFTSQFYKSVATSLKEGGIMVAQSESPWSRPEFLRRIASNIQGGFSNIYPYTGPVPTYPRGLWSWTIGSQHEIDPAAFDRDILGSVSDSLLYLNEGNLAASFSLPRFYREKVFPIR